MDRKTADTLLDKIEGYGEACAATTRAHLNGRPNAADFQRAEEALLREIRSLIAQETTA